VTIRFHDQTSPQEWADVEFTIRPVVAVTPDVNLVQILATALTETVPGYLAAAFKKLFDVVTPVFTAASVNQTGDTFAKFAGITSLAAWLRGMFRKDAMNAAAKLEVNLGGGNYDEATDSNEALADKMVAGVTVSDIDAAAQQDIADAMDLAPAGPAGVGSVDDKLDTLILCCGYVPGPGALPRTYTVYRAGTAIPEAGVQVRISTDLLGANIVWAGITDAFGVARDLAGNLPILDPGTWYFWDTKTGWTPTAWPDTEVYP
jgi:hypothetical protein